MKYGNFFVNKTQTCPQKPQGKRAETEPMYRQALADRTRVLGADHPSTIASVNNLAICLKAQGKYAEAGAMYRAALADRTRVLGADHPDTIRTADNLNACMGLDYLHSQ